MPTRYRNWWFLSRDEADADEGAHPPAFADARLDRWLADPAHRAEVVRVYEQLTGRRSSNHAQLSLRELHRFVKPRIGRALKAGELSVVEHPGLPPPPTARNAWMPLDTDKPKPAAPPEKQKEKEEKKTEREWVEFQLVDPDGKGLPGHHYSIKLPDGTIKTGSTGTSGVVWIGDIDAGKCEITFPDLPPDVWEPA
jgi:hypothetical protein